MNFTSQSNLQNIAHFNLTAGFGQTVSHRITLRLSKVYLAAWLIGLIIMALNPTLALAMVMPGGGFAASPYPLTLIGGTTVLFGAALFLWFATGNVLAPLFIWVAALLSAIGFASANPTALSTVFIFALGPVALSILWVVKFCLWHWQKAKLQKLNHE